MISGRKNKLSILFLVNHFFPEVGAIRTEYELAKELARRGHKVTVLTTFPRKYRVPKHIDITKYKTKRFFIIEKIGPLEIIRVKSLLSPRDVLGYRFLELFSSIVSLFIIGILKRIGYDVIICAGDIEFLASLPGILLKNIKKKPMLTILHDIHPKALIDIGLVRNKIIIFVLKVIEKFFYAHSDKLVVHSEGNKSLAIECGADPRKVEVIYLWADLNKITPASKLPPFRSKYKGKFIVSFAGVMHYPQGLDVVIEAARLLREHEKILFILVGDGPVKNELIRKCKEYNLKNVVFLPFQPKEKYIEILQSSDVSLVTLRKEYKQPVVPSKLIEIMAAGCPVILSVPESSDAVKIVKKAQCGICVPPESPKKLAEAILKLYKNRQLAKIMGLRGRKFAEENFSLKKAVDSYERVLFELISKLQV